MKATFLSDVRASIAFDEVTTSIRHVRPLVHLLVPAAMLALLVLFTIGVRIEHARAQAEVRSFELQARAARVAQAQLRLDHDIRHGTGWLEQAAAVYGLKPAITASAVAEDR